MGLEIVVNFPRGPGAAPAEGNISNTNFWTWRVINFLTNKPRQYPQWLNVMLPLDRTSWFFVLICLAVVSALFAWLSYKESPHKTATVS